MNENLAKKNNTIIVTPGQTKKSVKDLLLRLKNKKIKIVILDPIPTSLPPECWIG